MNPRRPSPEDLKSIKTSSRFLSSPATIDYNAVKENFIIWLKSKELNWDFYVGKEIGFLEKYARPIREPMDLVRLFEKLTSSQKRHLKNGYRMLFNFYEAQGLASKMWLDVLRKNLPKTSIGADLKVPSSEEIIKSLRILRNSGRFFALYNLLLDSGLRLTEGVWLYNSLLKGEVEEEKYKGFYVVPLGYFRGTKLAYYGFVTEFSFETMRSEGRPLTYKKIAGVITKRFKGAVSWKYLRKFANDIMTSEKLNIPESTADFIEGRVPRTIGARHYMHLKRKAVEFYPRYAEYLANLRSKAGVY